MIHEAPKLIPLNYQERLHHIVDESWKIFQSHFINEKHPILKEAPFQHHFANIMSTVGSLYCVSREDRFFVDLEAKCQIAGKNKFLDITCLFENARGNTQSKCAIELKFKTAKQVPRTMDALMPMLILQLWKARVRAGLTSDGST
jgi:hypothetical protein